MIIAYLKSGTKKEFFGIFSSKEIAQSKYKEYLEEIKLCKVQLKENIEANANLSVEHDNRRNKLLENLKTVIDENTAWRIYLTITVNYDYGLMDLLMEIERKYGNVYNNIVKDFITLYFYENRKGKKLCYPIRTNFPKGKTKLELEEIQLDDYTKPKLF